MPGADLAERRIWNPITEIASAGDHLIMGTSENERRAPDPTRFCVDVDLQINSTYSARPSQFVPVRMP
jgi:hypothetical protein